MGRNPAPQILHTDAIYLLEETFTKKLPLFPHIPDDHHRSGCQQQADKHPDIHAQFQYTHFTRLSLNLHFLAQYDRVLTVTHIQFGYTGTNPFATDGVIQLIITFQILICITVVTCLFIIMLQILVAYSKHIGIHMSGRSSPCYHFPGTSDISFFQRKLNHQGFNVVHGGVVLYLRKVTVTFIQIVFGRIQPVRQQIKIAQINFRKIAFEYHLRVIRYQLRCLPHIDQGFLIIFLIIVMISPIIKIHPLFADCHFIKKLSCQFVIMIGQIKITQIHVSLSQSAIDRKFGMFRQMQGVTDKQCSPVIGSGMCQFATMQMGIRQIHTDI